MILALLPLTLASEPLRFIGLSVVAPAGLDAALVARTGHGEPVQFVDDGSVAMDHAGDGEYWALVRAEGSSTAVTVAGDVQGLAIAQDLEIATPAVWESPVHVVTHRLVVDGAQASLSRVLTAPMRPPPEDETGAGAAAAATGWSARGLFLAWGAFVLALALTAVIRSTILEARQGDGTR